MMASVPAVSGKVLQQSEDGRVFSTRHDAGRSRRTKEIFMSTAL